METTSEVHLFPYGYFQHAKFSRQGNKDIVEIRFQETTVVAKGTGLESLCDALARLAVERIKICPAKYKATVGNESVIESVEIKQEEIKSDTAK